jgi:hypothetical protein
MCDQFLTALLAECQYPKRRDSRLELTIGDLLAQLELLIEHENTDIAEASIRPEDSGQVEAIYAHAAKELETIYEGLTSSSTETLVEQLNSRFKLLLYRVSLECPQLIWRKALCARLEILAKSLRLRLVSLENGYRELSSLTLEQRNELIGRLLQQFSREAWWSPGLYRRAHALTERLKEMEMRFPGLNLEEQRRMLGTALQRMTKYPFEDVISSIASLITRLFACNDVHPEVPIYAPNDTQATELLTNRSNHLQWNKSFMDKCSSQASVLPLLLVSRGAGSASEVLNALVSRLAPFTTVDDYQPFFARKPKAQILSFQYPGRPCNALLIYVNMSSNLTTKADSVLTVFSQFLASKGAVTCLIDTMNEELGVKLLQPERETEGDNRVVTAGEITNMVLYSFALIGEHMARPCTALRKAKAEAGAVGEVKCYKLLDEAASVAIQSDLIAGLDQASAIPSSSFQVTFRAAIEFCESFFHS